MIRSENLQFTFYFILDEETPGIVMTVDYSQLEQWLGCGFKTRHRTKKHYMVVRKIKSPLIRLNKKILKLSFQHGMFQRGMVKMAKFLTLACVYSCLKMVTFCSFYFAPIFMTTNNISFLVFKAFFTVQMKKLGWPK